MPLRTNSYPSPKHISNKRPYKSFIAVVVWLAIVLVALLYRQSIIDWWKLVGYHPPAEIASLASQDGMTSYAYRIFEVNHPLIESSSNFNINCPNDGGEKTIVLGCYHSDEAGIYLLNVTDSRLNGVEQVTAAHEMLHAAYARLSSSERSKVDSMLLNYFNHGLHDQRIINTMAEYRKTEPGQVVNEMHSVFGTEIANLPPALDQYYSRYFHNRQTVTAYAARYQSEFTTREDAVNLDDGQLATIKNQINSIEAGLKTQLSQINNDQSSLNNDKSSGDIAAYNNGVAVYNQQVDSYNDEIANLKVIINNYNNLVDQRNSIALTENQLYQELSGSANTTIKH